METYRELHREYAQIMSDNLDDRNVNGPIDDDFNHDKDWEPVDHEGVDFILQPSKMIHENFWKYIASYNQDLFDSMG